MCPRDGCSVPSRSSAPERFLRRPWGKEVDLQALIYILDLNNKGLIYVYISLNKC